MSLPARIEPEILVSWSGDGTFTGPWDDVTPDTLADAGLSIDQWRDGAQQLTPPKIAAGDFELHNERGIYSPERADSPIYQQVLPTRPVLFRLYHGEERAYDSEATYDDEVYYDGRVPFALGRHLVDDLEQTTDLGNRRVHVSTLGLETLLTRAPVTVPLMVNPRVDQCVTALLDAIDWPTADREIAVADTTLLLWWCDERKPWDALLELLASEGPGTFYVDRDGVFHFENRNYRTTEDRSQTSQATFTDDATTSSLWYDEFRPLSPFKSLFNRATYTTRRRAEGGLGVIWEYGADLTLSGSQTRALFVRPSDPFTDAVEPVDGVDYTVSAGSATVTLTYSSGFLAIVTVEAGALGATLTGLQLRAKPLTVVSETTVQHSVDTSASIAKYSPVPGANIPLTLPLNGWPEIDPAAAEAVCNAWVLRYQHPRPQVEITLTNGTGALVEQILARSPSDRITLQESNSGISADFWINSSAISISKHAGGLVRLVLGVERCDDLTGAVWDVSEWDSGVWGI